MFSPPVVIHMVSIVVVIVSIVVVLLLFILFFNGRMAFSPYAMVYTTQGQVDQQVTTITTINNSNQLFTWQLSNHIARAAFFVAAAKLLLFPYTLSGRDSERICCIRKRCGFNITHYDLDAFAALFWFCAVTKKYYTRNQKEDKKFFRF